MKKSDKLKVVFDFIADYLSEETEIKIPVTDETNTPTTKELITEVDVVETSEDNYNRSYEIMKKIDALEKARQEKMIKEKNKMVMDELHDLRKENEKLKSVANANALLDFLKTKSENDAVKFGGNLKQILSSAKELIDSDCDKEAALTSKLGATLNPDGKVISVNYKPLTENRGEIEAHISEIMEKESKTKN